MEEHQNSGEQITRHLLAGENQYTEEVRREHNNGEERAGDYGSSVTAVLLFSSFVAVCGSFNYGWAVGFTSPVESEIIDDLGLSIEEYSLFGSFLTVGGALGAIACGKMSDYLGRRGVSLYLFIFISCPNSSKKKRIRYDPASLQPAILCLPYNSYCPSWLLWYNCQLALKEQTFGVADVLSIGGWFAIIASQSALPLYLGRVLLGFALGLTNYVVPVYLAEITPKDLRGRFVTLNMFMMCCGIASAYVIGNFIPWRFLAAVGFIPNLSQLLGVFFIPESPRWLVKIHKENEFKAALQRLRGSSANISREATDIKEYTEAIEQTAKVSIFELFQRTYAYTLTVGIGVFALSQLDGTNGIIYYASSIFESAGLSSKLGSIMMAVVQVLSVCISLVLMDRFGRRPLLMVSSIGLCLACLLPGISFVLQDHGWLEGFSPYLALIGILMFCAFYAIGIGNITYILISEIYPINIKGLAGSVATLVGWVTSWFVSYVFNFSMEWSTAGTFFILTGICGFTVVFVAVLVPETKGRTLEEIQASINRKFRIDRENQP